MHIIISVLGGILSVMYLLDRFGIDIGWLNPFWWRHRRNWAKKFAGDPIYGIEDPLQIAALLVVGTARLNGDVSSAGRSAAVERFESEFSLSQREADELYVSAAHLLGGPAVVDTQLDGLLQRNTSRFSAEQVASVLAMMRSVAEADGSATARQGEFLQAASAKLSASK